MHVHVLAVFLFAAGTICGIHAKSATLSVLTRKADMSCGGCRLAGDYCVACILLQQSSYAQISIFGDPLSH